MIASRPVYTEFMKLNQAANGDREFGYIQSRLPTSRKTIAGHVSDAQTRGRIGSWVRGAGRRGVVDARGRAIRGQHAGRGGHRNDKVEDEAHFGVSVDTYGVNDLVEVVECVRPADVDKLVREYEHAYRVAPKLLPCGDRRAAL